MKRTLASRRTIVVCLLSAAAGLGVGALLQTDAGSPSPSLAQEVAAPPTIRIAPGSGTALPARDAAHQGIDPSVYADLTAEERVSVNVYEFANHSAVNINTRSVTTDRFYMRELTSEGEGTGTVLDREGHILTNFHVVDGAREIQVTLFSGKTYEAHMVGVDPQTDIAVLKIFAQPEELSPVTFGDSNKLLIGQKVFAIGNPFGLERTLSTGIISSLNRSLPARRTSRMIKSIIQIDAAINPGNSGGPLLDSRGRMIGMNTAIASTTGASAGVGFAIPVNTVARVVPQLIRDGRVVRPSTGIAQVFQTDKGLLIARLIPGGAAEKAGLRGPQVVTRQKRQGPFVYEYRTLDRSAADLIVAIDGQPIASADDYLTITESKQPGQQVVLTVVRDGKRMEVPLTLESDQE